MNPNELNSIANAIYEEHFGEKFHGWVMWSTRMKRIAGNCRSDGRIALNKHYYERYGKEEILLVLRHELAHLYCFRAKGRHSHQDPLFLATLEKLGGTAIGKMMPIKVYIYECPQCKKQWLFKSPLKKYFACAKCSRGGYNHNCKIEYAGEKIVEPELQE